MHIHSTITFQLLRSRLCCWTPLLYYRSSHYVQYDFLATSGHGTDWRTTRKHALPGMLFIGRRDIKITNAFTSEMRLLIYRLVRAWRFFRRVRADSLRYKRSCHTAISHWRQLSPGSGTRSMGQLQEMANRTKRAITKFCNNQVIHFVSPGI